MSIYVSPPKNLSYSCVRSKRRVYIGIKINMAVLYDLFVQTSAPTNKLVNKGTDVK